MNMNGDKQATVEHLKLIQDVVTRMAGNSMGHLQYADRAGAGQRKTGNTISELA